MSQGPRRQFRDTRREVGNEELIRASLLAIEMEERQMILPVGKYSKETRLSPVLLGKHANHFIRSKSYVYGSDWDQIE